VFELFVLNYPVHIHDVSCSHISFYHGATAHSGPGPPDCRGYMFTLIHTTVSSTPLDEWSACRRDLYLITLNTHKRQTSMPPAGFEPTICFSKEKFSTENLIVKHLVTVGNSYVLLKWSSGSWMSLEPSWRNLSCLLTPYDWSVLVDTKMEKSARKN
jgi:hypothetical protein